MVAPMTPGFFDAADGVKLYGEWYRPETAPRAAALILHGYADHCGRYAEVGRRLAKLGFAVLAFDYRGHGQAGGRRGHCDRFDDYLGDLERACARAREATGDLPLVLVAHSHGSLIVLRALAEPGRIPGVAAAVLASPFLAVKMHIPAPKRMVGRLLARAWPTFSLKHAMDPALVSHDAQNVAALAADRFCHKVTTARWFFESIESQRYVREQAGRITTPTLWLLAGDDRIADARVAQAVFERAGGDKRLVTYPGFFHEVFHESERARVYRDMEAWLAPRLQIA